MQREHEEAMRADFDTAERINAEAFRDFRAGQCTHAEFQERIEAYAAIGDRWVDGPYREHWVYLRDACTNWYLHPQEMQRKLADIEAGHWPAHDGVSDIQHRSIIQAREVEQRRRTERDHIQEQQQHRRIGRSR
ncbi:hypothetical protein [Nocardia gipuzkoensis]|uniref:hypothetical protein n=1 Tax=Nocardia gipuzkoensis TaxID=2749991 RepID=UPI003EDF6227